MKMKILVTEYEWKYGDIYIACEHEYEDLNTAFNERVFRYCDLYGLLDIYADRLRGLWEDLELMSTGEARCAKELFGERLFVIKLT